MTTTAVMNTTMPKDVPAGDEAAVGSTGESSSLSAAINMNGRDSQSIAVDPTEELLGISAYLSTDQNGFSAISKARYSDFVVHEVGMDGTVARLESLSPAIPDNNESGNALNDDAQQGLTTTSSIAAAIPTAVERKTEEEKVDEEDSATSADAAGKRKRDDEEAISAASLSPPWDDLESQLSKWVGAQAAAEVIQFLKRDAGELTANNDEEKYVSLPSIDDKTTRREVHHWIRSSLQFCVEADTADDADGKKCIRLWPKRYASHMPNYEKFDNTTDGRRNPQQQSKQKRLKRPESYLKFVLYKENCDTHFAIKQLVRRLGGGGRGGRHNNKVRVGYSGMKDKRGITTQFCTLYQRAPHEIIWINQNNQTNGGGNTSTGGASIIRVGNFEYAKEELRLGMLRGNRFDIVLRNAKTDTGDDKATTKQVMKAAVEAFRECGFINFFGIQRFGKYQDTHLVGIALIKGDFSLIVDIIMEPKTGEKEEFITARNKWKERFENISEDDKEARANAEVEGAKKLRRIFGHYMTSELSILESLSRKPLDYKLAFSRISRTMRMMFLHAVQSLWWNKVASCRIQTLGRDVVVGDLVLSEDEGREENDLPFVKVVTEDDITANRYQLQDVVLPLVGTKTILPENASGKLFESLMQEQGIAMDMLQKISAQDRDLSCPGDYRKLICRPHDVDFAILEYSDPLQPLLQTDLMKLNKVDVLDIVSNDNEAGQNDEKGHPLLGMTVGFTLPSSAYATMALRELMKRATSPGAMGKLELGSTVDE